MKWPWKEPVFKNKAEELIWRSTGIFGDFDFPLCTKLIRRKNLYLGDSFELTEVEIQAILWRYYRHVPQWSRSTFGHVTLDVVKKELMSFAAAVGRPYPPMADEFIAMMRRQLI